MNEFELGWLVGIIEGEGSISIGGNKCPRVGLEMVDKDTILHAKSLIEQIIGKELKLGYIHRNRPNTSEVYRIQLYGDNARTLLRIIVPYLKYRRRQKAWQVLNGYNPPRLSLDNILPWRKTSNVG
jgi:hypothetical protein